jgi:H2-forming N5,N10-methylenetetrahydromethanopterin dehydrogenase-like enzyme
MSQVLPGNVFRQIATAEGGSPSTPYRQGSTVELVLEVELVELVVLVLEVVKRMVVVDTDVVSVTLDIIVLLSVALATVADWSVVELLLDW